MQKIFRMSTHHQKNPLRKQHGLQKQIAFPILSIIRRMIEDAAESFWPKLGCYFIGNWIANYHLAKFWLTKTLYLFFVTDFIFGQIGTTTFLRHCRFITPFWSRWKEKVRSIFQRGLKLQDWLDPKIPIWKPVWKKKTSRRK